jgi:hypothetical protein
MEELAPTAYPGQPIPPEAQHAAGRITIVSICAGGGTSYVEAGRLPTTGTGMLAYLRTVDSGKRPEPERLWKAASELLRETYLPPAQRSALFEAIKLIPGVTLVPHAKDVTGREGLAVALVGGGVQDEFVLSADTFQYLGENGVVVDAAAAGVPVGSVLAASALISVTVADEAPAVAPQPKGTSC